MADILEMHFEEDEVAALVRLARRLGREAAREIVRMARAGADFDEIWAYLRRAVQHVA